MMRHTPTFLAATAASLCMGCATPPPPGPTALMPDLREALAEPPAAPASKAAAAPAPRAPVAAPADALQGVPPVQSERRFSLVLANASPDVLFMSLLSETPLSVAVDPAIKGPLSITLKDVTLREALELLRELHNLEYKVIGRHILVSPAQMATRIFHVDYPTFNRSGRSDLRVTSGSISATAGNSGGGNNPGTPSPAPSGTGSSTAPESTRITTSQKSDLWAEVEASLRAIVGEKDGRQVVVSPQTGTIVIRALPREMRAVQEYLEATRASVQRQVMLEAKVVEVQLRDSERTGINWAAFKNALSTRATAGALGPGGLLALEGAIRGGLISGTPGQALEAAATNAGSVMGLAIQTSNFAAVIEFLGTQGHAQVLSSPRIATLNNQKAVLKVGTDDFFVTSISTTTTAVGNTTQTTPNIGVQPFFSGISLDVTPHINADGYITLHVHPAVSAVTERSKVLNLGTQGSFTLPLASSDINETDAVVRALDGHIIAIGGLMRQATSSDDSGIPGSRGNPLARFFGGQTSQLSEKRELVILLKPTIIDPNRDDALRNDALSRLIDWTEAQVRSASKAAPRKE
ncbi:MAG: secretin N-terminal domain-containing protein [Rubrivivax sp.]|nr:secretin N-terminal domain-containing protein [Rubrivivax sp.]